MVWTRRILVALGVLAIGFGAVNALLRPLVDIVSLAVWFTVPAVLSDLVLLPVVAALGGALTAKLAPWARLPVQVGGILIGTLLAVAIPFLGRPGLRVDNPTLLNRNYPLGCAIYVAVILVAMAIWAMVRRMRVTSPAAGTPQTDR